MSSHLYRGTFFFVNWWPCMEIENTRYWRAGQLPFQSGSIYWLLPVATRQQLDNKHSFARFAGDADNGKITVSNIGQYRIGVSNK